MEHARAPRHAEAQRRRGARRLGGGASAAQGAEARREFFGKGREARDVAEAPRRSSQLRCERARARACRLGEGEGVVEALEREGGVQQPPRGRAWRVAARLQHAREVWDGAVELGGDGALG